MHLKTLTLRGFKSFASSTTLRLEPGITCVVGPNGSGKSNVVDALAWVMGEQGAKSLRGAQMADVIFAGTTGRPALGRAQVELTIDNSDGLLPIEYSEVTLSRTLFRGGGSEYSINGTSARLLDIQELLSDTGMGRQMHVIVGQGQLDAILSSTPEERRGFIEEAAGVLKHRRRKERALRKLADMDQNLVRVLDLTNELHRQLKPLARQAKVARRATLIQARVRDAKARILADDLVSLRQRLEAHRHNDKALGAQRERLEVQLKGARDELERNEVKERASNPRLEGITQQWRELTELHERLRGVQMLAAERADSLSRPIAPASGEDPHDLDRRAAEAGREDARLLHSVEEGRRALDDAVRKREECEIADERAARELARVNRVLADHREKVARLTGDVSASRSRLEAATSEAERAEKLVAAAKERQRLAEAQVKETSAPIQDGTPGIAAQAHANATAARDQARARVDELLAREKDARAERAKWEARRDTLAESLTPDDATARLAGAQGVLGDIPSMVTVEAGWEDAVSALFAPFADAAVVTDIGIAVDNIRRARHDASGRIRMVVAETRSHDTSVDRPALPELPDGARWMVDIVSASAPVSFSVSALIEGAVACSNLDQIDELLAVPSVDVVVTSEGDVFAVPTVMGSGSGGTSVLTLHAQYDQAVEGAAESLEREQVATRKLVEANEILDRRIRDANDALRRLREEDAEHAKAAEAAARAASAAGAAASETQRSQATWEKAREQVAWATQQVEDARSRLSEASDIEPEESLSDVQRVAEVAALAARKAREEETAARLALRTEEERSRHVQARARSLRQAAAREREERARLETLERQRVARLAKVTEVRESAVLAVEAAQRSLRVAEEARIEAERERTRSSQAANEVRRRIEALSAELTELTSESHRDEVAQAETILLLEQLEERIIDSIGLEPDDVIEEYGPHKMVPVLVEPTSEGRAVGTESLASTTITEDETQYVPFVRAEQEKLLRDAQRDLDKLGKVNPLALEEYDALARRHEFLVVQTQDLKKSKADLLHIIDDVDRMVEEAFTSAFNDTREQFAHTFSVLFPGGEGSLVLTEPEDMLATGIEIEARPAGKKVKRLSLLSGGERSLAAMAFLVSIFKARPSPFYVMDEVEAALDDVNLSRLLKVFRELQETSQLIVITHQKRTMEIADALYGITMRDGVTRVVSQRLTS